MKTTFGIKNFRVFDENGVDIELAPITILTGKNSAGKSSIVKAFALLHSFLEQIRRDKELKREIELAKYRIEFNKVLDGSLGNFESLRHKGSNDHTITFEYTTHSCMLFQDVKVSFTFVDADEGKERVNEYMHNGKLCHFSVRTLNDEVIFSTSNGELFYNLNLIKKQFPVFSLGEFYAYVYQGQFVSDNADSKQLENEAEKYLNKIEESQRKDVYKYILSPFSGEGTITDGIEYRYVKDIDEGKQIFYIPIIDECFSTIDRNAIPTKVDEILDADSKLDINQKAIIKRFVNEILLKDVDFADFWKKQEELFLNNVVNDGTDPTSISYEKGSTVGKRVFVKWPNEIVTKLPTVSNLSIRTYLWADYYECYDQKKTSNNICGSTNEHPWTLRPINNFSDMYEILMRLNSAYLRYKNKKDDSLNLLHEYKEVENSFTYREETDVYTFTEDKMYFDTGRYSHNAYKLLCEYASKAIEEILFPEWGENFFYVPSTRALPLRVYTKQEGKEFFKTLNDYLNAKTEYEAYQKGIGGLKEKNKYIPDTFLNNWIGPRGFGIGKNLSVESFYGAALVIKLIKNDGSEILLTDEGFGLTQLLSILIAIETTILKARGMSYKQYRALSRLAGLDIDKFHYEHQTIAVEEPEIHLHPAYQSLLADMFASASEYNIHFIVETHSEYLIRKLQVLVAGKDKDSKIHVSNEYISILYVNTLEYNDEDDEVGLQVKKIEVNENGYLDDNFGKGFFDEARNRIKDLQRN